MSRIKLIFRVPIILSGGLFLSLVVLELLSCSINSDYLSSSKKFLLNVNLLLLHWFELVVVFVNA